MNDFFLIPTSYFTEHIHQQQQRHHEYESQERKNFGRKIKLFSLVRLSKLTSWFESTRHVKSLAQTNPYEYRVKKHTAHYDSSRFWYRPVEAS